MPDIRFIALVAIFGVLFTNQRCASADKNETLLHLSSLLSNQKIESASVIVDAAMFLGARRLSEEASAFDSRCDKFSAPPDVRACALLLRNAIKKIGSEGRIEYISIYMHTPKILLIDRRPEIELDSHVTIARIADLENATDHAGLRDAFKRRDRAIVDGDVVVIATRDQCAEVFVSQAQLSNIPARQILSLIFDLCPPTVTVSVLARDSEMSIKSVSVSMVLVEGRWKLK